MDCTLRDGGYYNNWDFPEDLVSNYLKAAAAAKIDLIELGLRSFPGRSFKGANAFTTERYINQLDLPEGPAYGVMVDAKTLTSSQSGIISSVNRLFVKKTDSRLSFVRVATHYHEVEAAIVICRELQELGYFVGLNLMQTVGKAEQLIIETARKIKDSNAVDVLYFADSFGNMQTEDQHRIIRSLREVWEGDIGLHAHDNMSRALSNTLEAVELGVSYLDSTITGMGRGAGNTKTEVLLLELCDKYNANYNPEELYELVLRNFEPMQREYGWGSNLLYHIGATANIHPTYIQQLCSDTRFGPDERSAAISYLSTVESSNYDGENLEMALNSGKRDYSNQALPGDDIRGLLLHKEVLLIGSGESTQKYASAISDYISERAPIVIAININETIPEKFINYYTAIHNAKFLTDNKKYKDIEQKLIAPRSRFEENSITPKISYEIRIGNNWESGNSHCTIPSELTLSYALSICEAGGAKSVSLVGFDGYAPPDNRGKDSQETFDHFKNKLSITCLTPTSYNINAGSIYAI